MTGVGVGARGAAALLLVAACTRTTLEGERPTSVTLSADPTEARVGEEVTFRVEAEGSHLLGILLAFGDGAVDSLFAGGARTATMTRAHAYGEAGTYEAWARAEESSGVTAADTLTVVVLPGG